MRLDKFLSNTGTLTRKEANKLAKKGYISVNDEVIYDASIHINEDIDIVKYNDEVITYNKFTYIMMNKPSGYVSATSDSSLPYICELLEDKLNKIGLFPMGRLDKDTTGLIILTNNGDLSHYLLSPKHHVEKTYEFSLDHPLNLDGEAILASGIKISDEITYKPAKVKMDENRSKGTITLTEGKYHEIKIMMEHLDNKVTKLKRTTFAGISLDKNLKEGEYRPLTKEEISILESNKDN